MSSAAGEMCGFECDWKLFPSKETQLKWFRSYLAGFRNCDTALISNEDIEGLYEEVRPWALLSHMWWGFWAVVQAATSPIDFDYLTYSVERFQGYLQHKQDMPDVATHISVKHTGVNDTHEKEEIL